MLEKGAPGCFLINHDFGIDDFLPIIKKVRIKFPSLWLSVNFLAETGKVAFPILSDLSSQGCFIDGYWGDDACIDENGVNIEAKIISKIRNDTGWKGLYFGGTALKTKNYSTGKIWRCCKICYSIYGCGNNLRSCYWN